MKALDQLRQSMLSSYEAALARTHFDDVVSMQEELERLRNWVGGGTGLENPGSDRILLALVDYRRTGNLKSLANARLVSYGCIQPIAPRSYLLIQDRPRFVGLLNYVESHRTNTRQFRKCYRGLLNGYIGYDPETADEVGDSQENWEDLRKFLDNHKRHLETPGVNPEWISALQDHSNLLTMNPCKRYGLAALDGDRTAFEDIRNRLGVRDDSWIVRQLVSAQIDAAVGLPHTRFRAVVDPLIALLDEHPMLRDGGLAKILDRYASYNVTDVHQGLSNFSVTHWKNPWLPSNAAKWGSVKPESREMVSGWLKLRLISQFFSLLAEDGANDTRRVEFWKRYHDQIEDMYFILGNDAMTNRSLDFREMRHAMAGLLAQLYAAGAPSNNAFVMMIGDFVVVEFGSKGNAAYIFNRNGALPFQLRGHVAGNSTELKNQTSKAFVERLIHNDTGEGTWETRFERMLRRRAGVGLAGNDKAGRRAEPQASRESKEFRTFSGSSAALFCLEFNFIIQDRRSVGGSYWLYPQGSVTNPKAVETLARWNFRWAEKKQGYYLVE